MAAMTMDWKEIIKKPVTGSVLSVMSGLSFFFNCMLLSLVGPSGARAPDAAANQDVFLGVSLLTFLLAAATAASKMMRRAEDESPRPYGSFALCIISTLMIILTLSGLFAI